MKSENEKLRYINENNNRTQIYRLAQELKKCRDQQNEIISKRMEQQNLEFICKDQR